MNTPSSATRSAVTTTAGCCRFSCSMMSAHWPFSAQPKAATATRASAPETAERCHDLPPEPSASAGPSSVTGVAGSTR
jgi:hypothetical protein